MKNDKPLISVIVPVYNGQDYLENCIRSIEGQSYGNLEVIIVNDGSTDQTAVVCDKLWSVYDNVRVFTLNDEGVSAARNAGIDAAEGDFITFVDADDRLRPEMLQILYDCIIRTGSDAAGCKFFLWRNEAEWEQASHVAVQSLDVATQDMNVAGQEFNVETQAVAAETKALPGKIETYDADRYLREAILQGNSRCWSKLYRREAVDQVRFQERLTIGEDMLFLIRMLPFIGRIAEIDYQGYGYFQNPNGAIQREFTPRYMDQITCWQLARKEILRMDQSLDAQVSALWMMGIMLTAGKLAVLPAAERREYQRYVRICHEKLKKAMSIPGAYGRLSAGYQFKAGLFLVCPKLYLCLYHLFKTIR